MHVVVGNQYQVIRAVYADVSRGGEIFGNDLEAMISGHAPNLALCKIGHVHVAPLIEIHSAQVLKATGEKSVRFKFAQLSVRRDFKDLPLLPAYSDEMIGLRVNRDSRGACEPVIVN